MSSRTAAARKRLQNPPPKISLPERSVNQPKPFALTRADLIPSTSPTRDAPLMHTSVQRLDLSNEFTHPLPFSELPSPEYSPTYFPPSNHHFNFRNIESNQAVEAEPSYRPFPHPHSNHRTPKWIDSDRVIRTVPTYEPSSPYEEDFYQSRRPLLRVDPYVMKYQNLPLPPPPSPGVLSLNPISPATGPLPYVPDSPISPKYLASMNKHDHLAASYTPRSPSLHRSDRHSLAPSDLPEYRSTYSSHRDSHISVTNKSTRRDNRYTSYQPPFASRSKPPSPHAQPAASPISPSSQYTSYQLPSASRSNPPSPHAQLAASPISPSNQYTSYQLPSASRSSPPSPHTQLAALSIPPSRHESRLPIRYLSGVPNALSHSSSSSIRSSKRSPHERYKDSASLSCYSGLSSSSPSTPTSNGTWQPPAPPPSPNFFFPGSRSVARPRVTSKITISQLKKRSSKLRAARSQASLAPSLSPISPSVDQMALSPVSPVVQSPILSNHPDSRSDEGAFVLSDDSNRKVAPSVPEAPPENFIFPTARSRAQPKISSKPKSSKSSSRSSKSKDANSGRSRFIGALFKKKNKNKGKTPNITPISNMYTKLSDPVASTMEHTPPGKRISEGSSYEFTAHQERTRKLKSRSGSYPLDPYNSVLLDNDRHTGELLSRLNRTGSPSFHDYGTTPPSSVLDLGCGQGHWVLEAAIAWKAHGTHVTGYDMVDISRSLLPWAAEHGVRDNIRFVRGNFLKQQLPFSSNTFDLVRMSCLALCITLDSWGFILQEVYRVLVAGGRLELIDDQIFFPYGKVSSLMDVDDTDSIIESAAPKLDSVLSPSVTTFSIYGDVFANPGLGSTVGHRSSDDDDDDGSDHDGGVTDLHDHKGKVTARLSTAQPRSIVLSPEAWDRSLSISEDLEALFEHMLFDAFDIHKDPSDFISSLMKRVFGQAREVETMNLVLAPPDPTAKSGHFPQQGLSHCPGLILWPSTFIPMDHTEVEIHASKHLRTLLSCKNFLAQHAIEAAEDERVDEEFVSEALWEYEFFLRHRFNPPVPSGEVSDEESADTSSIYNSTVESAFSESTEAMLEIQSEFRQRYAWPPERPPNTLNTQDVSIVKTPSPPVSAPSAPGSSSVIPNEVTHVRTFRVFEAVKLDNYILTYDNY